MFLFVNKKTVIKIAPKNFSRMHLPTGPTAVYHHHHHHHHSTSHSPPNTDWNLNSANIKGDGNLEVQTTSGTSSPPGSTSSTSQDLWWTERLILEAQNEFPNELGKLKFSR